ncbi:unnamed protein product [Paramecium pentaurelia]|uniref:Uncharacterized protein n=1 Tax=Paramecium pentaurelia TaxID=43138 RepID=A0A8S1SPZ8_9CILI|nr:unnamed protein product [Paramecium pentaurelia]
MNNDSKLIISNLRQLSFMNLTKLKLFLLDYYNFQRGHFLYSNFTQIQMDIYYLNNKVMKLDEKSYNKLSIKQQQFVIKRKLAYQLIYTCIFKQIKNGQTSLRTMIVNTIAKKMI